MNHPTRNAVHPVDAWLPPGKNLLLALQHLLVMYAAAVSIPIVVGNAIGLAHDQIVMLISADLFACGIATLIQTVGFWKFGVRLPLIQGCSFVAVTPMILIGQAHGMPAVYGATIAAGIFCMLIAPLFGKIKRFFPPVVMGTTILLIGLSLMPVGVRWAAGGVPKAADYGSVENLTLAAISLGSVLLIYGFGRGLLRNTAVLVGLLVGTAVAALMGRTDFSKVATEGWFGVVTPFAFGMPVFDPLSILLMCVAMMVIITEVTADFFAVGEMVGKEIGDQEIANGLRADGLSTVLGGVLNTFPYCAYNANVGLVAMSGVRSRWVVATTGVLLLVLGMFPKLAAVFASMPLAVLGGAAIVMFAMIATTGIRILGKVDLKNGNNALVIAASLGVGMITVAVPGFYEKLDGTIKLFLHSGITTGCVTAIVLNALFNGKARGADTAAQPAPVV
ncbi:nucleobase:cation symporter-2 family protein [Variovorax sp. 54]|uniref:nucleobase:cation symporter-2 family protein n=1 Tax=Variovorax sp. 54 TaxID=2035212 RepID=UPI000C1968D8|nr:nucleobase:cation symporter-2 family protein [Variovorax sp. 54]